MTRLPHISAFALAGCVLALSACGPQAQTADSTAAAPDTSPDVSVAAPVTPGGEAVEVTPGADPSLIPATAELGSAADMSVTEPNLTFSAGFDPALADFDARLAAMVRTESERELAAARVQADADGPTATHSLDVQWSASALAGDYLSVEKSVYVYQGGAHPNSFIEARLFDRRTGGFRPVSGLFRSDAAMRERLASLVVPKLIAEKVGRFDGAISAEDATADVTGNITPDADIWQSIALLPSTQDGKFGGFMVHFNPYDVGAYAEGPYDITIEQNEVRDLLTSEAAALFAGEPVVPGFE